MMMIKTTMFSIVPIITIGSLFINRAYIKTYFRLRQRIDFNLPKNYVKRNLEDDVTNWLKNLKVGCVHVLYAPPKSGKTTAIKKVFERNTRF
jgi:hypothetical protein